MFHKKINLQINSRMIFHELSRSKRWWKLKGLWIQLRSRFHSLRFVCWSPLSSRAFKENFHAAFSKSLKLEISFKCCLHSPHKALIISDEIFTPDCSLSTAGFGFEWFFLRSQSEPRLIHYWVQPNVFEHFNVYYVSIYRTSLAWREREGERKRHAGGKTWINRKIFSWLQLIFFSHRQHRPWRL